MDNQKDQWQPYLGKEVFQNSLVEIFSPTGEMLGVGCFVTTAKILTCLHPFEKMDVSKLKVTSIDGKKQSYKIRTATHENQHPDIDLLVIEVDVDHYRRGACVKLDLEPDIRASNSFSVCHPSANLIAIQALSSSQSSPELSFSLVRQEKLSLIGCPIIDQAIGRVCGIVSELEHTAGRAIPIQEIVNKLPDLAAVNQYITHVQCNLPERKQQALIGKQEELQTLFRYLSPQHIQHIIEINGVGGIGKTEMAITAANQCLLSYQRIRSKSTAPIFDAVVFISLESNDHNANLDYPGTGLLKVLNMIGDTLKIPNFNPYTGAKDFSQVYEALSRKTTLLILDGWDNSIDIDRIWNFLDNIPYPTKVLITARERKSSYSCISLKPLTPEQSRDFILQQALPGVLNSDEAEVLKSLPGVPSVLLRAIAKLRAGQYEEKREFDLSATSDPEISDINRSIDSVVDTNTAAVLHVLSFFPTSASVLSITSILSRMVEFKGSELENALRYLEQIQLILKFKSVDNGDSYYALPPNVRECVLNRSGLLSKSVDEEIRSRWVKWYCASIQVSQIEQLEKEWENIKEVLTWCQNKRDFNSIRAMWPCLDELAKNKRDWAIHFYWWKYLEQGFAQRGETLMTMRALQELVHTCLEMGSKQLAKEYSDKASKLLEEEPYEIRRADKYEEYEAMIKKMETKILTVSTRESRTIASVSGALANQLNGSQS